MRCKLLALITAALLVFTPAALAESGWEAGLSPARPFSYVEQADLSAHVGYMMTMPENETLIPCGTDTLIMYLPRTDYIGMNGTLSVTTPGGSVYAVADLSDTIMTEMSRSDLEFYGWGSGIMLSVRLDRPLDASQTYLVNIPTGAFEFDNLTTPSAEIDGRVMWTFYTAPFGIAAKTQSYESAEPAAGDSTTISVRLGGDAVLARVTVNSPSTLTSDVLELDADGDITIEYTDAGLYSYTLDFYDAHGDKLSGLLGSGRVTG